MALSGRGESDADAVEVLETVDVERLCVVVVGGAGGFAAFAGSNGAISSLALAAGAGVLESVDGAASLIGEHFCSVAETSSARTEEANSRAQLVNALAG